MAHKKKLDNRITELIPEGEFVVCHGGVSLSAHQWCEQEANRLKSHGISAKAERKNGYCWVEKNA